MRLRVVDPSQDYPSLVIMVRLVHFERRIHRVHRVWSAKFCSRVPSVPRRRVSRDGSNFENFAPSEMNSATMFSTQTCLDD